MAIGIALPGTNPNVKYQQLFDKARQARLPFDKEAWLNIAFYLGRQYTEWHTPTNSLRATPFPKNEQRPIRPVVNKIMHFVNQELSTALKTKPTVDVLPATDEPMDASFADVAKSYLDWLLDAQVNDFDTVLTEACLWALAGTEAYIKWYWDANAKQGAVKAVSPFDVYPDPYVRSFKDCRYIFHSQFWDVEQVYDKYGIEIKAGGVEKADPTKTTMMREMGFAPILTGAIVTEYWEKPNRRNPEGVYTVWTGNTTLVPPQAHPYNHKHLPFTQLGSILMPGNQHRTSAVTFLRSPQMEYNKYHAQMIQGRQNFGNNKWWIPSELELEEDPNDAPNQILRGNSRQGQIAPILIQGHPVADNGDGAWLEASMMDVVGQHEVSQGQVPGRVEAAQAIELLQEDDDDRLAQLLMSIQGSLSEGGWQQLMLAKQFVEPEFMVPIYSAEGLPEIKKFFAEKIDPGMRVRVQMGTGLSRSRAARTDQLMTLWGNGIIRDPDIMAQLLDVPVSSLNPDMAWDIKMARNENIKIAGNVAVQANYWDNHDIHRREHNNYRKTADYHALPNVEKSKFEFHVDQHDKLQVKALSDQLQRMQLAIQIAQGQQAITGQQAAPTTNPNEPQTFPVPGSSS